MATPPNMSTTNTTPMQEEEMDEALDLPFEDEDLEDEEQIVENEDGSVTIEMQEPQGPMQEPEFYANLAETFEEDDLMKMAMDYIDYIELDKESRKTRDKQYADGIRRSGLGDDAPGGANFEGANKVVHPVIAESCVDFSAASSKEIIPSDGIVKTKIYGAVDEAVKDMAQAKADFMNFQLNAQIKEYRSEMEVLLTQLPLGGSQFMKWRWDSDKMRPACEFVPIDNIYLPYEASSFYDAQRVTEMQDITGETLRDRIDSGLYRDVDNIDLLRMTEDDLEQSAAKSATDKVQGARFPEENMDNIRRIYEIHCFMRLEDDKETDGKLSPYILTIDENTEKVLALYRNWQKGDETRQKLDWMVEFKFIPWRGAYGIGLPHLIGGLSAALTGSLRALLDSAHISNSQTLLKLKGGRINGQTDRIEPTQVVEIEGAPGVDDVRKIAMQMPFSPPSNVLYNLLGWLTAAAQGVVSTAEEKISDVNANTPVGTTQALIEQGSKVASSIHARLHRAQERTLEILARLNHWYADEMVNMSGIKINSQLFSNNMDIDPVSDPNIFSETQRYAQDQAILQMATKFPQLYDLRKANERILKRMKIQNINEILPDPKGIKESNPALENVGMSMGQPAQAFPDQDHLAHLKTHLAFAMDANFGANPLVGPGMAGLLLEHIKQHLVLYYLMKTKDQIKQSAGGQDIFDLHKEKPVDIETQQAISLASQFAQQEAGQELQQLMPAIQQLVQRVQQQAQAQRENVQDPTAQAIIKTQMAETQRKTQEMQAKFQLDQQKMQLDQQKEMQQMQQKFAELQLKFKESQDQLLAQIQLANVNNESKERIEEMKMGAAQSQADIEAGLRQAENAAQAQSDLQADLRAKKHELMMGQIQAERAQEEAQQQAMMQEQAAQAEQAEAQTAQQAPQTQPGDDQSLA